MTGCGVFGTPTASRSPRVNSTRPALDGDTTTPGKWFIVKPIEVSDEADGATCTAAADAAIS